MSEMELEEAPVTSARADRREERVTINKEFESYDAFIERIGFSLFGLSLVGLRLFSVLAHALAILVSGLFTMRELRAETGWTFECTPRETVSVWALRQFGREPRRGDTVTVGDLRVTAEELVAERLRRVRVERLTAASH